MRGDGWDFALSSENAAKAKTSTQGHLILGVRHGHVRVLPESSPNGLPAKIYTVEPTGDITYVHAQLGDQFLVASTSERFRGSADQPIRLEFDQDHLYLFDRATGQAL